MKTTNFLPLAKSIKWMTVLASILFLGGIGAIVYEWFQQQNAYLLWSAILLVVVIGAAIAMVPRKLVVSEKEVRICLLAWTIHIPADEIVKIEHYPHGIASHRIMGYGGYFGNIGLFTCHECGKHLSLVTEPMNVCIITRKKRMPIVVSVADNNVFNIIIEIRTKV